MYRLLMEGEEIREMDEYYYVYPGISTLRKWHRVDYTGEKMKTDSLPTRRKIDIQAEKHLLKG